MEPDEFVGCILSIRTQPSAGDGASKAIIGTVRVIDTKRQTITLDDVMINGTIVDDGYILNSSIIQDLSVCGKSDQVFGVGEDSFVQQSEPTFASTPKKPLHDSNVSYSYNQLDNDPPASTATTIFEHQLHNLGLRTAEQKPSPGVVPSKKSNNLNHPVKQSAFVKTEKGKVDNPFYALNPVCGGSMGKGPHPTKPTSTEVSKIQNPPKISDARVVYTASELEKNYFDQVARSPSKSNAFESIMAQLAIGGSPMSKAPIPTLQNNLGTADAAKKHPATAVSQDQNEDPIRKVFPITADSILYRLIAQQPTQQLHPVKLQKESVPKSPPRQPSQHMNYSNERSGNGIGKTQQKKMQPQKLQNSAAAVVAGRGGAGAPPQRQPIPTSAFEMTTDEIQAEEFDFEENLAMFEKLPVTLPPKPAVEKAKQILNHTPQFGKSDTTCYAERHVSSIQLKEIPSKIFVTDTGVVVPAVSLATRCGILNMAHNFGLTHSRMVEIMGRAVATIVIPLLGDSYRLSPEREDDRPSVLVFAGPHWNGAVGVCAARVLATQGVRTNLCIWNYELPLFTTELQLYRLTKQTVTTDMTTLKGLHFDLVIGALNDHRDTTLNLKPFQLWAKGKPIVLVDPPVLPSYRKTFLERTPQDDTNNQQSNDSRLSIVTPTLPLAYPTEPSVKLHLVNLGIPSGIFQENDVKYKSPFGDKLILQLFATKQDISALTS